MGQFDRRQAKNAAKVFFGPGTIFEGTLHFRETLCIQGQFRGTIEAEGSLIVDRGAVVEADHISVNSLTVFGNVTGQINAEDRVDMMNGAEVRGDLSALRLRIADEVMFEGHCTMILNDADIDIFSGSSAEIKAGLQTPSVQAPDSAEPAAEPDGAPAASAADTGTVPDA